MPTSRLPALCLVLAAGLLVPPPGLAQTAPLTRAERTGFQETSTHRDVLEFLAALKPLPFADRLAVRSMGQSGEGRDLPLVLAGSPGVDSAPTARASEKLRILVIGNIHAGEVEGKEVLQMLLREIALGGHGDLLRHAVLLVAPIYNPDGNDRIDRRNRTSQNGPDGGVGQRPNAAGLDLNRDFVKAESPECQALLSVFRDFDPHLFMDLHTTNGSPHGYHLTYAPSLSPNVAPPLQELARDLLAEVRGAMDRRGFAVFDYGNFRGRGERRRWVTYDHRPRFGTNYFGLRNRVAVLSEAFSYVAFKDRVRVTRAFVVETLREAVRRREALRARCAAADAEAAAVGAGLAFHHETSLSPAQDAEVLVGRIRTVDLPEGLGRRRIAEDHREPATMPVQVAFTAARTVPMPRAWAIRNAPDAVRDNLLRHGLRVCALTAAAEVDAARFVPTGRRRLPRPFQGHRTLTLRGRYQEERVRLPVGTLVVPAGQPLVRVAAQLLEAVSEDGLATWNFFDDAIRIADEGKGEQGYYPVLRVTGAAELSTKPLALPPR